MTISYRMPESPNMQTTQVAHLRMLVVEDQPFQRRLLVGLLKSFGVSTVVEAHDGNEGLAALDREADGFDIAFVDLKMDGMDGIEFLRHAAQRSVRAFIVTSALEPELFSYVSELGSSFGASILGTLKKPITPDHISAHLSHFVNLDARRQTGRVASIPPPRPWSRAALEAALAKGEFIPFFQPKIDLKSRRAVGVEVLARWQHPSMGILPPSQFIGRMETEGLIDGLTESIVAAALAGSGEWEARGTSLNIAVNVSPLTLQKTDIAKRVLSLVRHYRAAPESITIEVTETAVSQDAAGLLETLTRLRMQGFNLSVDDFGTGYSSLQQLSELPFNEVKIDRGFVHGSRHNQKATIILESIIQLGSKLGMQMVAEGIETEDELQYLRRLGCPTAQGFYLAHPMSQTDLLAFLESQAG